MKRRWVRVPPDTADNLRAAVAAGLLAAGVGAVTFWVVRIFQAREPLAEVPASSRDELSSGSSEGA